MLVVGLHPVWSLLCLSVCVLLLLLLLLLFSVPTTMMPTASILFYYLVLGIAASPSTANTLAVRVTKLEWSTRFVPQVCHRWHKCRTCDFRFSLHIGWPPLM